MLERMALAAIAVYQRLLSPLWSPTCRFHPSCSAYTRDAILRYGQGRGFRLGLKRLARCHTRHPGGYDPVK